MIKTELMTRELYTKRREKTLNHKNTCDNLRKSLAFSTVLVSFWDPALLQNSILIYSGFECFFDLYEKMDPKWI